MPPPSPPADPQLTRMEVLYGLKRLLGREGPANVTPFTEGRVTTYGTDISAYDVPEIHRQARGLIEQALRDACSQEESQVILLAGNPGMGKTHLLNYFRQREVKAQHNYLLVSATNHWKIDEFEEVLLDNLVAALCHPSPDQKHPLQKRIEVIAFTALEQLMRQPRSLAGYLKRGKAGWLRRLVAKFSSSPYRKLERLLSQRDPAVFRHLDFFKFSGYVCERFLEAPGNPLHRYVLRVLLCYLFPEERELVLHWLRRRPVGGHFATKFGADEALDRTYKHMDAVRLLCHLFSPEVSRGLSGGEGTKQAPQVFLLVFDQAEGRDELFEKDKEEEWRKFFAHLSELYNSMPNVVIVFTMTLGLRDKLHARMEKQFQDRIRRDETSILRNVEDSEVLALYRRRLEQWIGPGEDDLHDLLAASGNPYLPFDQPQVLDMAARQTLRGMLEVFDREFRKVLLDLVSKSPIYDYRLWLRQLRQEESGDSYKDTERHHDTVHRLLEEMGARFAAAAGVRLVSVVRKQTEGEKQEVLELTFSDLADAKRWVRLYLARLPFVYKAKAEACLQLLYKLKKARYCLWLIRPKPIDEAMLEPRRDQAFFHVLDVAEEATHQALLAVVTRREDYAPEDWHADEAALVAAFQTTYLGDLFRHAAQMVKKLSTEAEEAPQAAEATPEGSAQ